MKQKQHHNEGRVDLWSFKLKNVVLVRNWRRGVARWIKGRIYQVKGPGAPIQSISGTMPIRFTHVDHLKKTAY